LSTSTTEKPFLLAIRGKILSAFVLAGLAIALALAITYFSFQGLLDTVDELASPNEKLTVLHQFFQNVAQLDQRQRAEAITNPGKRYADFLNESKTLFSTIDTLQSMGWKNGHQQKRLAAMKEILERRNKLFLSYLKFRSGFIVNRKFSEKLDSLSSILANTKIWTDSNITTTQRKTITTTFLPKEESKTKEKGFFSRIFRKKEDKTSDAKIEVKEELSVKIDTLSIGQRDSAMLAADHVMKSLGQNQQLQNKNMLKHELDLINANTILINQLLNILHETEEEELSLMRVNNDAAVTLVNKSILRIGIVLTIFFVVGALLIFLILTDIARTNFYRLQLVKAKEEAEELSQVKQRFLANMSHEIRTPLQSIVGYSEQLKKTDSTNVPALEAIQSSSEHLLHIVNEILDYSRIESGKFKLEREPFSLAHVVHDVSMIMQVQAEHRGLSFVLINANNVDTMVMGDAFRLRQILFNVLGNAAKFTERGSITFHVESESSAERVHARFTITDTGIGMNPTDIDRVFQQFEQANAAVARQYGGTGLGLTIVKTLVESQQGTLAIDSEPEKGTRVTIDLWFDKAPEVEQTFINENRHLKNTFSGTVLVVDDDPLILRLCSSILEKHGVPFIRFQDSTSVLDADLTDAITLVLLDVRMPGINGLDLCKALRKKLTKARIVALTAHVLPQEKDDLLNNCFDDVLTKPFREQHLVELIGSVSQPLSSADGIPGLDFPALRKMTMGDQALFESIIRQFVDETQHDIHEIDKYLLSADAGTIREIIHRLAGRTGQMDLHDLSLQLKLLETDLSVGKDFSLLIEDIVKVRNDLETALTRIENTFVPLP